MKYWTIAYMGEHGQLVCETFSEEQIIKSYFGYWSSRMTEAGKSDLINHQDCISDWCVVHWAVESDEFGRPLKKDE